VKYIAKLILSILIVFFMFFSCGFTIGQRVLTIGGDKNFPPYEFVDDDGEYRGFNVDLMRAMAIEMGWEIKLVPMDWIEAHTALQDGKIDAIQGMSFNNSRKQYYDFSSSYLVNSLTCFVRKDSSYIMKLNDLKGRRVAVQRSDSAAYILADVGEVEVIFFSDLNEAFVKLLSKQVDAVVGNSLSGMYFLQKSMVVDKVKVVGQELNETNYGVAVRKGNEELVKDVDKAIERVRRNGTYQKIYEKWFGKEIKPAWTGLKYALYTLGLCLIVALCISYIYFRWNQKLKDEVLKRTGELAQKNKELEIKQNIINESSRFKQQIIDSLATGLITIDNYGIITSINSACERILGVNENFIGRSFKETCISKYFDDEIIESHFNGGQQGELKEKISKINGDTVTFSYILTPIIDNNEVQRGTVFSFRDITEEKIIKRKLAEKDKMQSLGRLVAGIAHEIRNPLTSIKTYVELLPVKYDNESFRKKITHQVPIEISRLNELLTDLLDYAKPKNLRKEEFTLRELVNYILELFSSVIREKAIDVKFEVNNDLKIYADRQQIKQIIINIIMNSIESIESNGKINIKLGEEGENAVLSIRDSGIGIEEDELIKVFEPFYTTKLGGTGLGLSVCYQYAEENEGKIHIDSEKGRGTEVKIEFKKR
jgi:PAS domain S-box-containing protein